MSRILIVTLLLVSTSCAHKIHETTRLTSWEERNQATHQIDRLRN